MAKYTYKTYNIAGFHLPEGMYSIAELEQMLADFKEAKQKDMLADDLRRQLAQPDQWQGLTDEEIVGASCECVDDGTFNMNCAVDFARAIEAKLKEKNT